MKTLKLFIICFFSIMTGVLVGCNSKDDLPTNDNSNNEEKEQELIVDKETSPEEDEVLQISFDDDFNGYDTLIGPGAHKFVFKDVNMHHMIGVVADESVSAKCTPTPFVYRENGQYISDIDLQSWDPCTTEIPDTCIAQGLYSKSLRYMHKRTITESRYHDVEFFIEENTSNEPRQFRLSIDWGVGGANNYNACFSRGYIIKQQGVE